jgi:quercetin 2,3-dioxygenase
MHKTLKTILAPGPRHWVGDGFQVHGFLSPDQTWLSPFCLLDYNPHMVVAPSTKERGVGSHPHRGFETVTLAYRGKIEHRDSTGNGGTITEGGVQWMTAGSGIIHNEFYEQEFNKSGGDFQMVQLWVNLPSKHKMTKPGYQAFDSFPRAKFQGGYAEIIAGELLSTHGPAKTFSPITLANIFLQKNTQITLDSIKSHNSAILVIQGQIEISNKQIPANHLAVFEPDGNQIQIQATQPDTIVLYLSGEPILEPIYSYGPFLMNSRDEIIQAIDDYNSGKFGTLEPIQN